METNITTKSGRFFICTIQCTRQQDDGMQKKVKEQYLIQEDTFAAAEATAEEELYTDDLEVKDLTIAPFQEVFFLHGDHYYKVKVNILTLNETTNKMKKQPVYYLVQGSSTKDAQRTADEILGSTMQDYTIESIIETKILDILSE